MSSTIVPIRTRFRAYQLGIAGASFSYFAGNHFTLIEAMLTEVSKQQLLSELRECEMKTITVLHITSWDDDHCNLSALEWILNYLSPSRIEYPGYTPHSQNGHACLAAIKAFQRKWSTAQLPVIAQAIDPEYINSLEPGQAMGYRNILYHPKQLHALSNNNSTVKLFRSGCFNVLSLGDVEDPAISAMLRRCTTLCREVDIMILAHHGADNGFTTRKFLEAIQPTIAICSSNYGNEYDHPRQEIRNLLYELDIPLFTSKTGDVIMHSIGSHSMDYQVTNLISQSSRVSSTQQHRARKARLLAMNPDTVRNVMHPGFRGLR